MILLTIFFSRYSKAHFSRVIVRLVAVLTPYSPLFFSSSWPHNLWFSIQTGVFVHSSHQFLWFWFIVIFWGSITPLSGYLGFTSSFQPLFVIHCIVCLSWLTLMILIVFKNLSLITRESTTLLWFWTWRVIIWLFSVLRWSWPGLRLFFTVTLCFLFGFTLSWFYMIKSKAPLIMTLSFRLIFPQATE